MSNSIDIARFSADTKRMVARLEAVSNDIKKESREIFNKAAVPLIAAIQSGAPQSGWPHGRYKDGREVAIYVPGNLRRSFRNTLRFGRSSAVWIAPKLAKGESATGIFEGSRTDAYYAHMVEFGTVNFPAKPFVRPAFESTKDRVAQIAIGLIKIRLRKYNAQT